MGATGLDVFDTTLQETNRWLKSVMTGLSTDDRRMAFGALRATLHALRDRIGPENAVHLGAQLPMLLRGAYYEGWRPAATPSHSRHVDEFLDSVAAELPAQWPFEPDDAARASFAALRERIDPGEVLKLLRILPAEIRTLAERHSNGRA
jgi:uncharacterized protein (DUF2267 family)